MELRLRYWWDEQDSLNPGWYAVLEERDRDGFWRYRNSSMNPSSSLGNELDKLGKNDGAKVRRELRVRWPAVRIISPD